MMNKNEIGGYIELELHHRTSYHPDSFAINSCRNGMKYAIRAHDIHEIFVPSYTCPVVWQAIEEENCALHFYEIDEFFMPKQHIDEDSYILYTNYFGICNKNLPLLHSKYKNLIIDNAQAFYAPQYGIATTYSPRKFFGVSDGGYVYCTKKIDANFTQDQSYQRFAHLLKRVDCGANFGYEDFNKNDDSLIGEEIKVMSNLTQRILNSLDYENAKLKRLENFSFLDKHLSSQNLLHFGLTDDVPMYYPFLVEDDNLRSKLIKNKIFIPQCWRGMEQRNTSEYELYLKKYLFLLIIDQRYNILDMERMLQIINN